MHEIAQSFGKDIVVVYGVLLMIVVLLGMATKMAYQTIKHNRQLRQSLNPHRSTCKGQNIRDILTVNNRVFR